MFGGAVQVGGVLLGYEGIERCVHRFLLGSRLVDASKLGVSRRVAIGQLPDLGP